MRDPMHPVRSGGFLTTALLAGAALLGGTSCASRAAYAVPVVPTAMAPVAGLAAMPSQGAAGPYDQSNRLSLLVGQRMLDDDYWSPAEDQLGFGVEFSRQTPGQAIGWEVGAAHSSDDGRVLGFEFEGSTTELYGGVRSTFLGETETVRPYVGGGVSLIRGKGEVPGVSSDDDSSLAGYAHCGVLARVTRTLSIGLDLRALFGSDLTIAGVSGDADYVQASLVLSWLF